MSIMSVFHLKEGERVVRIVRRTPLVVFPSAALAFLCVAAPFFFMIPLFAFKTWGAILFALAVFTGAAMALRTFITWYWNAFVITDRRVIDVDQRGFFERVVSEAPFEKIQDVSYAVRGIWGTIFGFGTIVIQTAGTNVNLELPQVRGPKDIHHLITELVAGRTAPGGASRNEKVSTLLSAAAELNDAEARAFLTTLQQAIKDRPAEDAEER